MRFGFLLTLASYLLFASPSEARVFDVGSEKFAAYIRGTYFPTATTNTAFSESNGANITVDEEFKTNMSGEFGFVYASPTLNLRFGFELIRPAKIEATGVDGASAEMYDVKSSASVFAPKIGAEINLKRWVESRFFLNLGVGSATLTARNAYSFTTAGSTDLSVTDYSEDLRSTALLYDGSLGFETLMNDTTTFSIEAGYRMLNFTSIKHNKDNAIIGGPVTKGATATNADGSNRELNLGGPYFGVMFRFWLF